MSSLRRVPGSLVIGLVATSLFLSSVSCSDDGAADGGAAGRGGGAGDSSTGGTGSSEPQCRVGQVADAERAFTELAGSYTFRLLTSACTVAGFQIEAMRDYAVELSSSPRAIRMPGVGATPLEFTWDDSEDVVCESDSTRSIEIDGGGSFARMSFIGKAPSALVLGTCSGTLD